MNILRAENPRVGDSHGALRNPCYAHLPWVFVHGHPPNLSVEPAPGHQIHVIQKRHLSFKASLCRLAMNCLVFVVADLFLNRGMAFKFRGGA